MPKQPDARETIEEDPDVAVDPETSPSLFDDEEELDAEGYDDDDEDIEEEQIDLDDLSAMEGPDA